MKNLKVRNGLCAGLLTLLASPIAALADEVFFDLASAGAAGSGCELGRDAFLQLDETGNLSFSMMGFTTEKLDSAALAGRLACSLRVPIEIPVGHYIYELTYSFAYDLRKSVGAEGSIGSTGTVFGLENPPMQERYELGESAEGVFNYSHMLRVPQDQQCANGLTSGILQLTLIAGYQKSSARDQFELSVQADKSASIQIETRACE